MDNNNTYNQPPMEQGMPPQIPIEQRVINGVGRMKNVFPQWLTQYSIVVYILALMAVSFMYSAYSLPWYYILSGVVAVMVFFLYGSTAIKDTSLDKIRKESRFEKRIFLIAFIPRVIWIFLIYIIFMNSYGDAFGFENADAQSYHDFGKEFADALRGGRFIQKWSWTIKEVDISDMGYATYLGFVYWLTNDSIIIVRLLKCLWSALTVLCIYRLAKRNFGEQTGRVAAIFCTLWPNFWYYCGCQLKEVEMTFLCVLFVEQADLMLRSRKFTAWKIIVLLLIAAALFTVRTPLALVALLALVFSVVMSSSRVVNWGKRIIVGGLALLLVGVTMGNRLQEQAMMMFRQVQAGSQQENMEWRAKRSNANVYSKYAGAAVFAPMIFTIPFPTMVRPFDGQEVQQLNNGGNFIKNIVSGFLIFAIIMLILSGKWRDHMLPLAFMIGYAVVLAFSNFAQSERFHQPNMPFEMMFAAYGLSIAVTKPKYKRWFMYWSWLMFVACLAWNWFKLAGRGLA